MTADPPPTLGADGPGSSARHALVGPPDLWEMKRRFQIDFLRAAGLRPDQHLLDVGCGTLRGGIPLISFLDRGHYTGVEVRRDVLDQGRRELAESGLADRDPLLVAFDRAANLDLGRRYDVIWAFAVLIHLPDAVLDEVLAAVSRHLADDGVFFATANVGTADEGQWQGFPIVHRELSFYRRAFAAQRLTVADMGPLTDFGHRHPRLPPEDQSRQRMLRAVRS